MSSKEPRPRRNPSRSEVATRHRKPPANPLSSATPGRGKRAVERTARERDQLDLIATMRASDAKLRKAIVTAFSHDDGRALVAFGEVLSTAPRKMVTTYAADLSSSLQ